MRRFRPFPGGTPARDHPGDIFATLAAAAFQGCCIACAAAPAKTPADGIAIALRLRSGAGQKKHFGQGIRPRHGSRSPAGLEKCFKSNANRAQGTPSFAPKPVVSLILATRSNPSAE
ncbi:MAG: hypothetical protein M3Z96_12850 [Pseudomonadota bacterium]|nr:hypothetical protein [Pseudomonadota bacterium]